MTPNPHEPSEQPIERKPIDIDAMIATITPANVNIDHEWNDAPDVGEEIVDYSQPEADHP